MRFWEGFFVGAGICMSLCLYVFVGLFGGSSVALFWFLFLF